MFCALRPLLRFFRFFFSCAQKRNNRSPSKCFSRARFGFPTCAIESRYLRTTRDGPGRPHYAPHKKGGRRGWKTSMLIFFLCGHAEVKTSYFAFFYKRSKPYINSSWILDFYFYFFKAFISDISYDIVTIIINSIQASNLPPDPAFLKTISIQITFRYWNRT